MVGLEEVTLSQKDHNVHLVSILGESTSGAPDVTILVYHKTTFLQRLLGLFSSTEFVGGVVVPHKQVTKLHRQLQMYTTRYRNHILSTLDKKDQ